MFEIFLTNRAERAIKSVDARMKRRIETALDDLAYTYFPKKYDIRKLKGVKSIYRIRIGNYRIIYTVDFKKSHILVSSIIQRKRAY